ncbi:MAG: hypothetical protein UU25_C0037G0011 [Microgenomates group bacterium GW2011_GWB1_40_9]|uniref:Uncharacterized protein n=1 Tax=Candidatus Zambryskibacteria bacterium RIFCSPHIGHO2_01_FULL_46_30 TaxID=1802739 RepID=A0A1G2T2F0_9BACT|nr:MAG: hypothetical protein UU25_C0037G0011 [Microgenomates group bacterium GW2011_GWB1_40_9]OHA91470.1 MAG: hypothetical protein A2665_00885 [Candidatus Zambryskibacteria bacterium RIFCSPHIGHO2_01_FULL_46_30]
MSVNVYFSEGVRKLPGFKSVPYGDGSGDKIKLDGLELFGGKNQLYTMWNEGSPIPETLKHLVEKISCYETIPQMGHRESGIYRHKSAICDLMPRDDGSGKREKKVYALKITAKNLEDIQELLHKVKTGTIRPEESYEGHQQGKSHVELERELTGALEQVRWTEKAFDEKRQQFHKACQKNVLLRQYVGNLDGIWLPLCVRSKVIKSLNAILDDK